MLQIPQTLLNNILYDDKGSLLCPIWNWCTSKLYFKNQTSKHLSRHAPLIFFRCASIFFLFYCILLHNTRISRLLRSINFYHSPSSLMGNYQDKQSHFAKMSFLCSLLKDEAYKKGSQKTNLWCAWSNKKLWMNEILPFDSHDIQHQCFWLNTNI